nr:hypothetical protein BdHM001_08160 [Bdellovibrio sp. HM001]
MKYLRLIPILLFLQGCAFSKDTNSNQVTTRAVESPVALSVLQKNIIAAAKKSDINYVKYSLKDLSPAEQDFSGSIETPLSWAINNGSGELAQAVVEGLGYPLALGSSATAVESFVRLESRIRLHKKLSQIGSLESMSVEAQSLSSSALTYLSQSILGRIETMVNAVNNGSIREAVSQIGSSGLSCSLIQTLMLRHVQIHSISSGPIVDFFVNQYSCVEKMKVTDVEHLFSDELVRQFREGFSAPEILSYLSRNEMLSMPMWKIEGSSFLVSPSLVYDIAKMASKDEKFCTLWKQMGKDCVKDGLMKDSRFDFFHKFKIKDSRYQFIDMTGPISYSEFPSEYMNLDEYGFPASLVNLLFGLSNKVSLVWSSKKPSFGSSQISVPPEGLDVPSEPVEDGRDDQGDERWGH